MAGSTNDSIYRWEYPDKKSNSGSRAWLQGLMSFGWGWQCSSSDIAQMRSLEPSKSMDVDSIHGKIAISRQ